MSMARKLRKTQNKNNNKVVYDFKFFKKNQAPKLTVNMKDIDSNAMSIADRVSERFERMREIEKTSLNDITYLFGKESELDKQSNSFTALFKRIAVLEFNKEEVFKFWEEEDAKIPTDIRVEINTIIETFLKGKKSITQDFLSMGMLCYEDYSIFKYKDYIGCVHTPSVTLDRIYKYDTVKEYFAIPEEEILWEEKSYTL